MAEVAHRVARQGFLCAYLIQGELGRVQVLRPFWICRQSKTLLLHS